MSFAGWVSMYLVFAIAGTAVCLAMFSINKRDDE